MNIYMMIGFSGTGKSTVAKEIVEKKDAVLFSHDKVTQGLHRMGCTLRQAYTQTDSLLLHQISQLNPFGKKCLVLDGTHLTKEKRAHVIRLIKGGTKFPVNITAVHIDNDIKEGAEHRSVRDNLSLKLIDTTYEKDIPTLDEGFYSIITIHNNYA